MVFKTCCVPGCGNKDAVKHRFPVDKERLRVWLNVVNSTPLFILGREELDARRVCEMHFEDKYKARYNRLTGNAVPTLHLEGLGTSPEMDVDVPAVVEEEDGTEPPEVVPDDGVSIHSSHVHVDHAYAALSLGKRRLPDPEEAAAPKRVKRVYFPILPAMGEKVKDLSPQSTGLYKELTKVPKLTRSRTPEIQSTAENYNNEDGNIEGSDNFKVTDNIENGVNIENDSNTEANSNVTEVAASPQVAKHRKQSVHSRVEANWNSPSSKARYSEFSTIEKETDKLGKISEQNKCKETENEFDYFCESLAVQLKSMPLQYALICQKKLQNIMTEQRLHLLRMESEFASSTQTFTAFSQTSSTQSNSTQN